MNETAASQREQAKALVVYHEAERADPSFAFVHRALGIANVRLGNSDAAVEHYRRYVQLSPTAPDAQVVMRIISDYELPE